MSPQVHEIEPGYSREDFALPERVGFSTEVLYRETDRGRREIVLSRLSVARQSQ